MKKRLFEEGNESVTNCNGLKLIAQDGKLRKTDCANRETIFRLIQSIPLPNLRDNMSAMEFALMTLAEVTIRK